MAYSTEQYARALSESIQSNTENTDIIVKRFVTLVQKNNDTRKLPAIVSLSEKLLNRMNGKKHYTISSARPLSDTHKAKILDSLGNPEVHSWHIDPELVAGIKVAVDDYYELDMSFSRKLKKLFA